MVSWQVKAQDTVFVKKAPVVIRKKVYEVDPQDRNPLIISLGTTAWFAGVKLSDVEYHFRNQFFINLDLGTEIKKSNHLFSAYLGVSYGVPKYDKSFVQQHTEYSASLNIDTLDSFFTIVNGEKVWKHILDSNYVKQENLVSENIIEKKSTQIILFRSRLGYSYLLGESRWRLQPGAFATFSYASSLDKDMIFSSTLFTIDPMIQINYDSDSQVYFLRASGRYGIVGDFDFGYSIDLGLKYFF